MQRYSRENVERLNLGTIEANDGNWQGMWVTQRGDHQTTYRIALEIGDKYVYDNRRTMETIIQNGEHIHINMNAKVQPKKCGTAELGDNLSQR